jgi:general secretion pathway protein C
MPMPTLDRFREWWRASGQGSTTGANIGSVPGGRLARNWLSLIETLLLALLVVQGARLVWALVTPVDSFGDWRGTQAVAPSAAARQTLFAAFDPFFRTTGDEQAHSVVTSLALTLFGTRVNEGSGLGSAIIATPDGVQTSFGVGDEILPGVRLKAVAFDHVVIDRGGAEETIFLDQSVPAPLATPSVDGTVQPMSGGPPQSVVPQMPPPRFDPSVSAVRSDIGFAPRVQNGRVTGFMLSPKGPAFQAAGFQSGDVVTQVNGRPIASSDDLQSLQAQLVPGARLSLSVERGESAVPIALTLQGP